MLLPFVPLMKGGRTERVVRRCADRIRQEPNEIAAELETILAIFATYVIDVETLRDILRLEMTVLEDSPLVREYLEQKSIVWFEEGRQEGFEEGRDEGAYEATLNALKQTLTVRFEVALDWVDERLAEQSVDLEALQKLNEVALRVQTLADFETALGQDSD